MPRVTGHADVCQATLTRNDRAQISHAVRSIRPPSHQAWASAAASLGASVGASAIGGSCIPLRVATVLARGTASTVLQGTEVLAARDRLVRAANTTGRDERHPSNHRDGQRKAKRDVRRASYGGADGPLAAAGH